ncbi:hypothetical protein [Saccharomonospora iraqiensis]|uniref:hypothetical protein n=1 Tax=Saccharomonospora iraqiensis TaxID=52698 RepID=UPI000401BBB2|nr:hypothetical protein [Saccharomonospora iraqiensis]
MTERPIIVEGDELAALLDNLRAATRCEDCGGTPALVARDRDITAELLHRPDCPDVAAMAVEQLLHDTLGRPS